MTRTDAWSLTGTHVDVHTAAGTHVVPAALAEPVTRPTTISSLSCVGVMLPG